MGTILFTRKHLAIPKDSFNCHNPRGWGGWGYGVGATNIKARDAVTHPIMHMTVPHTNPELSGPKGQQC